MKSAFLSFCLSCVCALASGDAGAQGIGAVRDFSCRDALAAAPGQPPDQKALQIYVDTPLKDFVRSETDPVALVERWHPSGTLVARDDFAAELNGAEIHLFCALMIIEFRVGESASSGDAGHLVNIIGDGLRFGQGRIPVLLVTHWSKDEGPEEDPFVSWAQDGFPIPVDFDRLEGPSTTIHTDVFRSIGFFGPGSGPPRDTAWLPDDVGRTLVAVFPEMRSEEMTDGALAVCARHSCATYQEVSGLRQKRRSVQNSSPPPSRPEEIRATDSLATDRQAESAGDAGPEAAATDFNISRLPVQLTEDIVGAAGGLACLLDAIEPGTEILEEAPDCRSDFHARLRARDVRLALQNGDLVLVAAPAPPPVPRPRSVTVTFPALMTVARCTLNLSYESELMGTRTVALEPMPGDATVFRADVADLPVRDGIATFTLRPNDPLACGGSGRRVEVEAARAIEIPYFGQVPNFTAVQYVLLPARRTLAEDLGAGQRDLERFTEDLYATVASAHARVAARETDVPWRMTEATVGRLTTTQGLVDVVELNTDALRGDVRAFIAQGIGANDISDLSGETVPVRSGTLLQALRGTVRSARADGFRRLDLVMTPVVQSNRTSMTPDPCTLPALDRLVEELGRAPGLDITLSVFPLMKLQEGQSPDLSTLEPMGLSVPAPVAAGGLYRCRATDSVLSVFPFLVEPWRDATDALPRYTLAVSDQLAALLADRIHGRVSR